MRKHNLKLRKWGESMAAGTLVVTFYNSHLNAADFTGRYRFVLFRVCDPGTILHSFHGELAYGEKKTYTVTGLKPGNYHLVGLELPDPKPGNTRTHQFMIYAGLETVYDVCYLTNNKLAIN